MAEHETPFALTSPAYGGSTSFIMECLFVQKLIVELVCWRRLRKTLATETWALYSSCLEQLGMLLLTVYVGSKSHLEKLMTLKHFLT